MFKKFFIIIFVFIFSGQAYGLTFSWTHPQLEVRSSTHRNGLFTTSSLVKGTLLAVFGGIILTKEEVLSLEEPLRRYVLQIDDNLWIGSGLSYAEPADLINHSCSPNAGIQGQICLVALRDIHANEEITFDYATVLTQWIGIEEITCSCGSIECRKIIKEDDWKSPELQKKYVGYFSQYIQKKIN